MVTEPGDKWSYGLSAKPEPEPDEIWPPEAGSETGIADITRLSTGRWTSPTLGAYDPMNRAGADVAGDDDWDGDPLGRLDGGGNREAENGYFEAFGYGDDYGDGKLDRDFRAADGGGAADRVAGSNLQGQDFERQEFEPAVDDDYDVDFEDEELEASGDARRNAIEWAVVLVGAVLLALILRAVLLQAFWIPSPSMESTLLVRDRVLVNKISYRLHDINRGDVIVFHRTDEEIANNPELPRDVIKRVIALEGETIAIENNVVTIDGVELREPYLDEGVTTSDFGPEEVLAGHVFVMGDNRELSLDSRFETGPIAHDRVVGRAFFLFWPLDRLGSL